MQSAKIIQLNPSPLAGEGRVRGQGNCHLARNDGAKIHHLVMPPVVSFERTSRNLAATAMGFAALATVSAIITIVGINWLLFPDCSRTGGECFLINHLF